MCIIGREQQEIVRLRQILNDYSDGVDRSTMGMLPDWKRFNNSKDYEAGYMDALDERSYNAFKKMG